MKKQKSNVTIDLEEPKESVYDEEPIEKELPKKQKKQKEIIEETEPSIEQEKPEIKKDKINISINGEKVYINVPATKEAVSYTIEILKTMKTEKKETPKRESYLSEYPIKPEIINIEPIKPTEPIKPEITTATPIPKDDNKVIIENTEVYDKCPKCSGKIKRKKVEQYQDGLRQVVFCKDRKCGWSKAYLIKI